MDRTNAKIERALLQRLLDRLKGAGYRPEQVHLGHEGGLDRGYRTARTFLTIHKHVAESGNATIHFVKIGVKDSVNRGVFVVPGNGSDFISDWHIEDKEFSGVVDVVSRNSDNFRIVYR